MGKGCLLIGHEASRGGAPLFLLALAKHFDRSGYALSFLLRRGGPLKKEFSKLGTVSVWNPDMSKASRVKKLVFYAGGGTMGYRTRLIRKLLYRRPVAVLNNTITNGDIVSALRSKHLPIVSIVHELDAMQQVFFRSAKATLEASKHVIAVSNGVLDNLKTRFGLDPSVASVVYPGADYACMLPSSEKGKRFTVISGGAPTLLKGIDVFLQVAQICKRKLGAENILFQWMGVEVDSLPYLVARADIRKLNLEDCVELLPETDRPADYYSQAHLCMVASREESFSLVMLEAAQMHLPILAFRDSGGPAEFIDNSMGRCVPYLDATMMADTVIELYSNKPLRIAMGEAAYDKARMYTSEEMAQRVLSIIEGMCNA